MLPPAPSIYQRPCQCQVGEAVEAICVPDWEIAHGFHYHEPVESDWDGSPWKFRRSAVPGRVTLIEIVWVRES